MTEVFLSVGSNVDREHTIAAALSQLQQRFGHLRLSPVYESHAANGVGDDYYNLCVELTTSMSVKELRTSLRQIEDSLGRDRSTPDCVPIDLDILLYGDLIDQNGEYTLPHPDVLTCAHVLVPLNDLAPELIHPQRQQRIANVMATEHLPATLRIVENSFSQFQSREENKN